MANRGKTGLNTKLYSDVSLTLGDLVDCLNDNNPSKKIADRSFIPKDTQDEEVQHLSKRLIYLPYILGFAKRAQENHGSFPLREGGSTQQDCTSGEGRKIHASHIIRAAVDERFYRKSSTLYDIFVKLCSVTENQWKDINVSGSIGGEIDRLSGEYIACFTNGGVFSKRNNIRLDINDPVSVAYSLADSYQELKFGNKRESYLRALINVDVNVIKRAYLAGYNLIQ